MRKKLFIVFLLAVAVNSSAAQGLSPTHYPRDYCFLGAAAGLPTRPFNNSTGTCGSNYVDVGKTPGRNGMFNNLAFYSMGSIENRDDLQRVSMILNVNNVADTKTAREALVKSAAIISKKILGAEPAGLAAAIRGGQNAAWTTELWRAEVAYRNWPSGLGHDISVRFIPTSAQRQQQ